MGDEKGDVKYPEPERISNRDLNGFIRFNFEVFYTAPFGFLGLADDTQIILSLFEGNTQLLTSCLVTRGKRSKRATDCEGDTKPKLISYLLEYVQFKLCRPSNSHSMCCNGYK